MKKTVEKSKHTVWLLSMLTVMVVLSAYYLVSDPIVPADIQNMESEENQEADIVIEEATTEELPELTDEIGVSNNDLLVGLKMERNNSRSKQIDQYYSMMQSDLSEEAIAELQDKIERLQSVEESEFVLEKLLVADGYEDAVVLSNGQSVDVIIQTDSISKAEAVKIIKLVSERLNIPAVNVHIKPVQ